MGEGREEGEGGDRKRELVEREQGKEMRHENERE